VLSHQQREVAHRHAGDAIVETGLLSSKLGKTAFRLWSALLTIRNGEAEAHPSMKGMAKAAGSSIHQARKSLNRLREAKLVEDYGFMWQQVPCSCKHGCWGHKVYVRTVYGAIHTNAGGEHARVQVPRATSQWLKLASTHGGKRTGAGRKRGPNFKAPENKANKSSGITYKYPERSSQRELRSLFKDAAACAASPSIASDALKEASPLQRERVWEPLPPHSPALAKFLSSVPGEGLPSFPVAGKRSPLTRERPADPVLAAIYQAAGVRMHDPAPVQPNAPAPQAALVAVPAVSAAIDFGVTRDADGTITLRLGDDDGRPAARQRYTVEDLAAMPTPHDIEQEIRPASIPPPPRLPDNASPEALVAACMLAMRAGHERVLGRAYWRPPSKRQLSKAEHAAVLAGAGALLEQKLAPLPWVLFSLRQWHGDLEKTDAAPLKWIFDPKRIEKHHGWCRQAVGSLNTGAIIRTPAYQEVVKRNHLLRTLLGWGKSTADVVREVYPPGVKARLWAQAREEADKARKLIQDQMQSGEWLWGNM